MDLVHFTRALRALSADDIVVIAADLADLIASPAEEVFATRASITIAQSLRRAHREPQAGLAEYSVAEAVRNAAQDAGVALPNDKVTRVGRNAAMLARGMVAGAPVAREVDFFARGFRHMAGVVGVAVTA